jgi:DNA-binding PadR family transcriptional regulator
MYSLHNIYFYKDPHHVNIMEIMQHHSPQFVSLKGLLAFQILHELSLNSYCGDELANIIGERKGSKLTPGTIYPVLKKMRKNKLIEHKKQGRKKMYKITEIGLNEHKIVKENFLKMFGKMFKDFNK